MSDRPADSREDGIRPGLIGAGVLLAVIALRCVVGISPDPFFDVDPFRNPLPWFGIGPTEVLFCVVLTLGACSLVLFGECRSGRGLDRLLLLLAAIPLVPIILHGMQDADDLWRGLDWFAVALGAVALAHVARAPAMRATVIGCMVGVVALLAVQGGFELLVEHPATLAFFEANRDAMLRSFGWEPGSVQAALYERRLEQPEASGWFGLANIFSGLMVVGLLLLLGTLNRRLSGGATLLMLLLAVGVALLIIVNGSKAALAATFIGCLLLLAPIMLPALRVRWRTMPGLIALGVLLLSIIAVVVRGQLGDDFLGGERSLLFRWHYLLGAARILAFNPWLGVGPAGFQEAYLLLKPEFSPEDPVSAHNMLIDWITTLGILGTAWILLLALLACRRDRSAEGAEVTDPPERTGRTIAPIVLLVACGVGMFIDFATLSPLALVVRLIGLAVAITIAISVRQAFLLHAPWKQAWCLGAALTALLALGSVDMVFVQAGSAAIVWGVVGVAARVPRFDRQRFGGAIAWMPALLGIWVVLVALLPQWEVARRMEQAATVLRSLGGIPGDVAELRPGLEPWSRADAIDSVRTAAGVAFSGLPESDGLQAAMDGLDFDALAPGSNDPRLIAPALVRALVPVARAAAVRHLEAAVDIDSRNLRPTWAMVEQLRLLAAGNDRRSGRTALLKAVVRLDDTMEHNPTARSAIASAWVLSESAAIEGDPDRRQVTDAFLRAISLSPHDPRLLVGLARAYRAEGAVEGEAQALAEALRKDEVRSLDPLVQFSPEERTELRRRLDELEEAARR